MPAMIVALIAMPFGLDEWPLRLMGLGIDAMMAVAKFVASIPGALITVPAFPFAALLVMVAGGLWLIIWRRPWRIAGLSLIGLGVAMTSIHDRPDIYIDRYAKVVAVRDRFGKLEAPKSHRSAYALGQWLKADGDHRGPKAASFGKGWQCDDSRCLAMVKGLLVSFVTKPQALEQDCQRAGILVASMDIEEPCAFPKLVFDRGTLWEKGAAAVLISATGLSISTASDARGVRPWASERHRKLPIPASADDGAEKQERAQD